jgi:periplasmic protein TonB
MPSTGAWRRVTEMPSLAEPLGDPPRLTRRRADGTEGRLSRDRLITMVVLAALLHGLVILGVSFTAPATPGDGVNRGLEILLVSEELPEARSNDSATYLAQRTQAGSGNTRERLSARLPAEAEAGAATATPGQQAEMSEEQLLATTNLASRTLVQMVALPEPTQPPATPASEAERQRVGDEALRLRGEARDELYVTADTRASRLAPYLDGWRRRVERVGTVNYPSVVQRRSSSGNPVIEVALQRDGKLKSAKILHSSGQADIDAAALAILRLASPFEPFPEELGRDYRSLRFAYEWQFEGGGRESGVLTVP